MLYFESDSKSNPLRIRSWVYEHDCYFLNATEQVEAGSVDHLHLDPEGHARMAQLVKDKINEIFAS